MNKGEIDYKSAGAELKSVKILDEKNSFSADAYFHSLHLSNSYWVALLLKEVSKYHLPVKLRHFKRTGVVVKRLVWDLL